MKCDESLAYANREMLSERDEAWMLWREIEGNKHENEILEAMAWSPTCR